MLTLEFALPPALLLLGADSHAVAYIWASLVAASAVLTGLLATSIARVLDDARVILQLRSQRLVFAAAIASVMLVAASLAGVPPLAAFILHIVIASVLGAVGIGHTLVAFGNLRQSLLHHSLAGTAMPHESSVRV